MLLTQHKETVNQSIKLKEIDQQMLSVVDTAVMCMHSLFCIPKPMGGGRLIVDCSLPKGRSANNYTNKVSQKFKYKSIDNCKGRFVSV